MNQPNTSPDKPRSSVIIPAYNSERFIGATIQSVLAQTYKAAEIIIVDDGSSDHTATVVEQYSGQIAISYVCQQNNGHSAARNHGVSLARGDWVAFLGNLERDALLLSPELCSAAILGEKLATVGVVLSAGASELLSPRKETCSSLLTPGVIDCSTSLCR